MTVPSTTRRAGPFTGTGALVAYPFTFKVFAKQDLAVTIADSNGLETDLVLDSSFTVTLNVDQEATPGGTVNYAVGGVATALPSGYTLVVTGDGLEFEQTADLPQGGNFSPVVVENALDRIVMLLQRLWDGVRRSMRLPDTASDSVSTVLPVPTANNFIGWDSNATALRNVDPNTLATVVAFAAWQSQAFSGDGVTTQFTLSSDPGNVNNLDVVVGAVPQRNNVDFTLSGVVLTFDVAPANGVSIFARWGQALPEGTSTLQARLVSTASAADGSGIPKHNSTLNYVAGTIGAKLYEANVCDYPWLAKGDGATDDWAAIEAANLWLKNKGGGRLIFPNRCPATGAAAVFIVGYRISIYSHVHYCGERGVTIKASASSVDNIIGEGNNLMDASVAARAAGGTVTRLGKPDFLTNYTEVEAYINGGYNGYAKTDVEITGIIFDGNKDNRSENQLNLVGAPTGTFLSGESVTSSGGGAARLAYVYPGASVTLEPRTITGSFNVGQTVTGVESGATMTIGSKQADDAFQNNIRLMNVSHSEVSGCEIKNSVFTALSVYDVCNNVKVHKNLFRDNNKPGTTYTAGWLNIYVEYWSQNITIEDNDIIGGLGYSVLCSAMGGQHRDTKIVLNRIYNPASDGIRVSQDSGTDSQYGTLIAGNTIMDAAGSGSCAIRLNHGGSSGGISEARVYGNTIRTCEFGILFQGRVSDSLCHGNTLRTVAAATAVDTTGATLTGNASWGNLSDSGAIAESGQTFIGSQYVKGGTTQLKGAKSISVGTTDTTIYTVANANYQTLLVVSGDTGTAGFVDLLSYAFGGIVVISSGTAYGAPSARTYSRTGTAIQLRMAANTYNCKVTGLENQ